MQYELVYYRWNYVVEVQSFRLLVQVREQQPMNYAAMVLYLMLSIKQEFNREVAVGVFAPYFQNEFTASHHASIHHAVKN